MDGYAPAYVAHNVPLLVVSGLEPLVEKGEKVSYEDIEGFHITSEVSPVNSADSQALLGYFRKCDAEGLAWNGREHTGRKKFKVKIVGRVNRSSMYPTSVSY